MRPVLCLIVFVLTACQTGPKSLGEAKLLAKRFHEQLNSGQFAAIYEEASPQWRSTMTRAKQDQALQQVRDRMGACRDSEPQRVEIKAATGEGETILLAFATPCERGTLDESFRWHAEDGKLRLIDYKPRSISVQREE